MIVLLLATAACAVRDTPPSPWYTPRDGVAAGLAEQSGETSGEKPGKASSGAWGNGNSAGGLKDGNAGTPGPREPGAGLTGDAPGGGVVGRPEDGDPAGAAGAARGFREPRGRVSPVYEQWLHRQSMTDAAERTLAAVPASRVLWNRSAGLQDNDLLRKNAPTWARFPEHFFPAPELAGMGRALPALAEVGIRGLWLGTAGETDAAFVPADAPSRTRAASFELTPRLGSDDDLKKLLNALSAQGMQSGMDTLSAATGLGPDFLLQARGSSLARGLYALWEIPESAWDLLPAASDAFEVRELAASEVDALRARRLLPPPLFQDAAHADSTRTAAGPTPGPSAGYAATGRVLCTDGQTRRYVYRWQGDVFCPVLAWQDPSGGARRLLAASVLRTAGLRHQALCGLDLSAFAGLDRAVPLPAGREDLALVPWPTALEDTAQTVRRCGAWSLARNVGGVPGTRRALEICDFVEAPGLDRLVARAMESGDATPLAARLRGLVSLPWKNLTVMAPLYGETVNRATAAAAATGAKAGTSGASVPGNTGVAGAGGKTGGGEDGVGVSSGRTGTATGAGSAGDGSAIESSADRRAREAHLSQALAAGLPGLAVLDASVLVERDGTGARVSRAGLLLAPTLQIRHALDLGAGGLVKVVQPSKGLVVAVAALPKGGFLVTALNFSRESVRTSVGLPGPGGGLTPLSGHAPDAALDGTQLVLSLQARQAAHYLAGSTSGF